VLFGENGLFGIELGEAHCGVSQHEQTSSRFYPFLQEAFVVAFISILSKYSIADNETHSNLLMNEVGLIMSQRMPYCGSVVLT